MAFFDNYAPQDWSAIISEVMRQAGLTHLEITGNGISEAEGAEGRFVVEILLYPGRMVIRRIPLEEAKTIIAEAATAPGTLQPEIYGDTEGLGPTKH